MKAMVNIYPNPSNSAFKLNYIASEAVLEEVRIYDLTGKMIEEVQLDQGTRDLRFGNDLPKGLYFVKMINDRGQTLTKKVTKL